MSKFSKNFIWLLLLLTGAIFISLTIGTRLISPAELLSPDSQDFMILTEVRIPRILAALIVGGLLSLSGLLMQNLVKNPLADPYILGVSGASACIQLILIATGWMLPSLMVLFLAFAFSSLSLWLLVRLASRTRFNTQKLLLSGVVLAFAYAAIISLTLTLSPLQTVKPMLFWLMGDLSYANHLWIGAGVLLLGSILVLRIHNELDMVARGEFFARKSGVAVDKIHLLILLLTTFFTTVAVNMAGTIGFIGLVIPHLCRLLVNNQHRWLIPYTVIIGAVVLLVADTMARTVFSPIQIPVGVFTAFLGVPLFLILQWRRT